MKKPILYLGPEGTYSHEAAIQSFGREARLKPCMSHYDLQEQLCDPQARPRPWAVVPVENSSEGPVTQTLDMLATEPDIRILESFTRPVHHTLMAHSGNKLAQIRRVYSHPQALGQCRQTLRKLLPQAELLTEASTVTAAQRVLKEPGCAAIASAEAAHLYGLEVLQGQMQDNNTNVTKFFIVTGDRHLQYKSDQDTVHRSLIYLVVGNRPGALLHVLSPFQAAGINLTFIQSRPLAGRPWEYGFFIEADTDWQTPAATAVWRLILALAESGRQLGTYPTG